jgi:hypothetical protein
VFYALQTWQGSSGKYQSCASPPVLPSGTAAPFWSLGNGKAVMKNLDTDGTVPAGIIGWSNNTGC